MKKSIAKNSLFNVAYKLLNVLFPLVTSVYLARVLLPEGVGKVGYAQNLLSYFLVFATMGIPNYGAREIARAGENRERSDKLFTELFLMNGTSTVIWSAIYLLLIYTIPGLRTQWQIFLAVGLQLFLNIFNVDWYYTGKEEFVYITVRSTVIKVISIVCIFLFIKDKEDLVLYATINALAITGNYLFNIYNLRGRVKLCFHELNFLQHIKPVIILMFTILATDVYNQVGITIMGFFCTDADIGYYTYAVKLIIIVTSVSVAIAGTTLPRVSQYYGNQKTTDFDRLINRTLEVMLILAIPCMVGLWLVGNDAVLVLFGDMFLPTVEILRIAAPVIIIVVVSYEFGPIVLTATNNERYLLAATACGAFANVAANMLLVPQFAGRGAAIAYLCAEITVLLVHVHYGKRYADFKIKRREIFSMLCASGVMIIIVFIIQNMLHNSALLRLGMSVALGAGGYGLTLLLMKNQMAIEILKKVRADRMPLIKKLM